MNALHYGQVGASQQELYNLCSSTKVRRQNMSNENVPVHASAKHAQAFSTSDA